MNLLNSASPSQIPNPQRLIVIAIKARNVLILQHKVWYLEMEIQYTFDINAAGYNSCWAFHHNMFEAEVEVYWVLVEIHPYLKRCGFGHDHIPVMEAIENHDLGMLRFLMSKDYKTHIETRSRVSVRNRWPIFTSRRFADSRVVFSHLYPLVVALARPATKLLLN